MNTIFFDSPFTDEERRKRLYDGQLFVFSPSRSSVALCHFARELIQNAFGPLDPLTAQYRLPIEEYVNILVRLKPTFIHHPKCKELIRGMLNELGCDLTKTFFDVPRMRTATSDKYLTSGIAYAFHPHRDTWYSAPFCQLNWWLPIYDIAADNALAFHPRYWGQPVRNTSSEFNYYEYNSDARKNAAKYIHSDTRKQPRAEECVELDPQIRIVTKVGGAILFSGAQLHSTVPNTSGLTRFSIDFRTVNIDDVMARTGARNVDSACSGTALRDFMRATDLARLPQDAIALYEEIPPVGGVLVFEHANSPLRSS
jgi:hypothetical protein